MIKGVALSILPCAPALAGESAAWGMARDACLTPMENVMAPGLQGRERLEPPPVWVRGGEKTYIDTDFGHVLTLWGEITVQLAGCSVTVAAGAEEDVFSSACFEWASAAVASGRYSSLMGADAPALESFEWREPRLRVALRSPGEGLGVQVKVREVDLQS